MEKLLIILMLMIDSFSKNSKGFTAKFKLFL